MLDADQIARQAKIPLELATQLLAGMSKNELTAWIQAEGLYGEANEVRRMNIIGGLRGLGYDVTGGRKGRNQPYQIVGWNEKVSSPGIDAWSQEDRETYNWVHSLDEIQTPFDISTMINQLGLEDRQQRHENSALQIWSYEMSGNQAFRYQDADGNEGLIIQKFREKPVFRIIPISLPASSIVPLVEKLGRISYRPITIINTRPSDLPIFKSELGGRINKSEQAIYNVSDIASFKGRSPKSIKNIKRLGDRCVVQGVEWIEDYHLENVISAWRAIVEARQRQLSIVRDYRAIHARLSSKITTVGVRHYHPVSFQILDWMPGTSMAAQIVEKALNFRSQLEGEPGTSDFSLWRTCQILESLGIEEINAGMIEGGTKGLEEHKRRLMIRSIISTSFTAEKYHR